MASAMSSPEAAPLPTALLSQALSPGQLLAMLLARRLLVIACALGLAVLAGILSFVLPRQYEATATLRFNFDVYDPTTGREFPSNLAASYMSTQADIIGSAATLEKVVERLGWLNDPKMTDPLRGKSNDPATLRGYLAEKLAERIIVKQSKESRLINITARMKSREAAASTANLIAQVFLEDHNRSLTQPVAERVGRYEGQLKTLRERVSTAQKLLSEYRQQQGLIDLDGRIDVEAARLIDLEQRVTVAEARRRDAQLRLSEAQRASAGIDSAVLGSPLLQGLKSQLSQRESQLASLSRVLGPNHPEYRQLQSELEVLRQRVGSETGLYLSNIRADAAAASAAEAQLRNDLAIQRDKVLEMRARLDAAADLKRELDATQQLYGIALSEAKPATQGSQQLYSNAELVQSATPPLLHVSPKARLNVILGLFAGGLLGVFVALGLEFSNRRLRSQLDYESELGLPLLAVLPQLQQRASR